MTPFDRSYTTHYWSAILSTALSCTILVNWRSIILWPWNLGYGSLKLIGNGTIRKLWYGFLFAFHGNCGYILYRFGDKAKYWSKIAICHSPCIRRPRYRGLRQNINIPFGAEKVEWFGYAKVRKVWGYV